MVQTTVKVSFSKTNVTRCMCPQCPVQVKSVCVKGKAKSLSESLKRVPLQREDIPGMYCSTGTAACADIDTKQNCICPACWVFSKYNLGSGQPVDYFCSKGAAR
ncbi:MAG: DUF2769 domain-containing protein [Chloroflexi bacterium]|nr:DUF2769 domain-containing protein [Chloroflexota bacterium]